MTIDNRLMCCDINNKLCRESKEPEAQMFPPSTILMAPALVVIPLVAACTTEVLLLTFRCSTWRHRAIHSTAFLLWLAAFLWFFFGGYTVAKLVYYPDAKMLYPWDRGSKEDFFAGAIAVLGYLVISLIARTVGKSSRKP